MPKRRRGLYRLVSAPLSRSRERIREHRAGELEPPLSEPVALVPSCRTATGRIASTFEGVRSCARIGGGDLADGLAALEVPTLCSGGLRKLGQTEADPAGVGAADANCVACMRSASGDPCPGQVAKAARQLAGDLVVVAPQANRRTGSTRMACG
jgi:hypothetical protein